MHKLTTQQFIEKAIKVHGDKYGYSKVEYINNKTKIKIICPKHGEFKQIPSNHLKGTGCNRCAGKNKTTKDLIAEFINIHGDKYGYLKVEYKNAKTNVIIICSKHGEFTQTPNDHLKGNGCKKCGIESRSILLAKSLNIFIEDANKIHNNYYDYYLVEYINNKNKVIIICPKHGEFKQIPSNHLKGRGCDKCVGKNKTTQDLIAEFTEIHGDKYDYSLVEYKNAQTKIIIICPQHGEFTQTPNDHLQEAGCPKCVNKNETKTGEILTELLPNIRLERQLSWGKLFNNSHNKRKIDFSFEKDGQKYIVEYNGGQHYFPVKFGKMTSDQAEKQFKKQQQRDQQLRDLCKEHNINLIEIDGRKYQGSKIKDYLIQCFSS